MPVGPGRLSSWGQDRQNEQKEGGVQGRAPHRSALRLNPSKAGLRCPRTRLAVRE